MKKLVCLITAVAAAANLSACGSVYSNYREMEQLLVLQTLGVDSAEGGGVVLSLSSTAASGKTASPVRMSVTGATVASAAERARNVSFEETLFISHADSVVLGEDYAKGGIADCVDYITQSPRLRIDMPICIIRGASAEESVLRVGDESAGISEVLRGVREYSETRSPGSVYTVADITRDTLRHGSALVCALELAPSGEYTPRNDEGDAAADPGDTDTTGEGNAADTQTDNNGDKDKDALTNEARHITAAAAGYAVLRDMKLCAYISAEDALGLSFLKNSVGQSDVTLTDDNGAAVTLEINDGSCDILPRFSSDGALSRVELTARVNATVLEADGTADFADPAYIDRLTARLESYVSEKINRIMRLAGSLEADFVGLGAAVERAAPPAWTVGERDFASHLPGLELRVSVNGQIIHSNDTRQTVRQR